MFLQIGIYLLTAAIWGSGYYTGYQAGYTAGAAAQNRAAANTLTGFCAMP